MRSRFITALAVLPLLSAISSPSQAETLQEALTQAYNTNPSFQAQLVAVRIAHERIPEARAGWLPTIFANADTGVLNEETEGGFFQKDETRTPASASITLDQPLYRGGRTVSSVLQAELEALAQQEVFRGAEQDLLRNTAATYMDVIHIQAVLELTRKNEAVLERQLQAVRYRYDAGDVTKTDISQAEARLAGASARRRQAEGALTAIKTAYRRITGQTPVDLADPDFSASLPDSLENAVNSAQENNPALRTSLLLEEAADEGINLAVGGLLPSIRLEAGMSHTEETAFRDSETDLASATLRLSIPLYQGGAQYARVRQARELQSKRLLESRDVRRLVEEDTVQAWEALETARANIESFEAQVKAADSALNGVRDEEQAGTRTVLDVLDAEQELLDAQVELVGAERNAFVATLDLSVATGILSAKALDLPVKYYDIEGHNRKARNRLFGTNTDMLE